MDENGATVGDRPHMGNVDSAEEPTVACSLSALMRPT